MCRWVRTEKAESNGERMRMKIQPPGI